MKRFLYFAYGSNMLSRRLRERTPSAQPVEVAWLPEHRLTFDKVGRDGSGKCHIQATGNPDDLVRGVIYSIESADKPHLDGAEGLGQGYDDQWFAFEGANGSIIEAVSYVGTNLKPGIVPFCWYKSLVLAGACEHGLPGTYVRWLETFDAEADPDEERRQQYQDLLARSKRSA